MKRGGAARVTNRNLSQHQNRYPYGSYFTEVAEVFEVALLLLRTSLSIS